MGDIRSHRDLLVWQKAVDLAVIVYRVAKALPAAERFGMWSQMTRSATSVSFNIAEGRGRQGSREFANFLSIARGSLAELDTAISIAVRLNYLNRMELTELDKLADEVGRMLTTLINRVRVSQL